jgi:predicted TIM-barrel fold metal-dependent hydrolase
VAVEASPWLEDNLWLLRVADEHPLVAAVVGNIPPGHPDFRDALGRFAKHPLFRGIRINLGSLAGMNSQPAAAAGFKLLAEKDLSLDILVSGRPAFAEVARLAEAVPALRIVVGHLPLYPQPPDLRLLAGYPNVYAKVSGVVRRVNGRVPEDAAFYRPALDALWEIFGPGRTIYASNWPTCDMTAPYNVVFRIVRDYMAGKDPQTMDRYFWSNAAAVYRCAARKGTRP